MLETLLAQLTRDKKTELAGEQVRLAGRGVELKDEEAKAKQQIEKAFADAGLKVPLMKEVLDKLPVDKARAQKWLPSSFAIASSSNWRTISSSTRPRCKASANSWHGKQDSKNRRRDIQRMLGVTRKYAIPLLEYLDQQRITRRVGDERIII